MIEHMEGFLERAEADALLGNLLTSVEWTQRQCYGSPVPRLEAWFHLDQLPYRFGGVTREAAPWPKQLLNLLAQIRSSELDLNSCLVNLYRDGSDSVAWHSDDEPELGAEPLIYSLSLGSTRKFSIRHKRARTRHDYRLGHGDLVIMRGTSQEDYEHCVPKTKQVVGPRLNLTFRRFRDVEG